MRSKTYISSNYIHCFGNFCCVFVDCINFMLQENNMLAHRLVQVRRLVKDNREDRSLLLAELKKHKVDISTIPLTFSLNSDDEDPEWMAANLRFVALQKNPKLSLCQIFITPSMS